MAILEITREEYLDRAAGGWLGRMAGATLGIPFEGSRELRTVAYYDPVPGQPAASDGLDCQLLWLRLLREHGPDLSWRQMTDAYERHLAYHWDEYAWTRHNLRRGLEPPLSGSFDNWFRTADRAITRAEVWAMTAPGCPQVAAAHAHRDASIDHADDGVWAAMFWAAMESAAFFVSDVRQLLEIGLAMVPSGSRAARAARIVRDAWIGGQPLTEARARVLTAVGHENYSDAPQNLGMALIGFLYGTGFGSSLATAVNLGLDTDGTAGAVGGLLGILHGRSALPREWIDPLGEAVVIGWGLLDLEPERTVAELASHTLEAAEGVLAALCPQVAIVEQTSREEQAASPVARPAPPPPAGSPEAIVPQEAGPVPGTDAIHSQPPPGSDRARFVEIDPLPPVPAAAAAPAPGSAATQEVEAMAAQNGTPAEAMPVSGAAGPPQTSVDASEVPAPDDTPAPAAQGETSAVPVPEAVPVPAVSVAASPAVDWTDNSRVRPLWAVPANSSTLYAGQFEITADYGPGGPVLVPNAASSFTVAVRNKAPDPFVGHVRLEVPAGWQVAVPGAQGQRQMLAAGGMARFGFVIRVPDSAPLAQRNSATLILAPEAGPAVTAAIPFFGGFCWWVVGPFRNLADEGYTRAYGPEDRVDLSADYVARDGGLIRWQRMAFPGVVMDLEPVFNGSPGVLYALALFRADHAGPARIVAHCNDGVRVWLAGRMVIQRHSHEPFRPTLGCGPASADVELRAGDNPVLVKVVRCGEPVRFALSLTDRDGQPLQGVGSTRW